MKKSSLIYASSLSAIINVVFVTTVTILAELNAPLKDWLKSLSGHHWTSKSIISVLLYLLLLVLFYIVLKNVDAKKVREAVFLAILSALSGSFLILGFFTAHNFGWF